MNAASSTARLPSPMILPAERLLPISAARGSLALLLIVYTFLLNRSAQRCRRLRLVQGSVAIYHQLQIAIIVHTATRVLSFGANLLLSQFDDDDHLDGLQKIIILLLPEFTALSLYIYIAVVWLDVTLTSSHTTATNCDMIISKAYRSVIVLSIVLTLTAAAYTAYAILSVSMASTMLQVICWSLFVLSLVLPFIAFLVVGGFFLFFISGFPFRSPLCRKRVNSMSWILIFWSMGRILRAVTLVLFFVDTSWTTIFDPDKFSWIIVITVTLSEVLPISVAQEWKVLALFLIQDPPQIFQDAPRSQWSIPSEEVYYSARQVGSSVHHGRWRNHEIALHDIAFHRVPPNLIDNIAQYIGSFCGLTHDNLVTIYGVSVVANGLWIIEEWMPMGNLDEFIQRSSTSSSSQLGFKIIYRIMLQLVGAMQYLSELGVVHGFLSCSTVFVDAVMNVRVGGAALFPIRQLVENQDEPCTGYEAPEILSGEGPICPYSDVYSVGCILNTLCTGRNPFPEVHTSGRLRSLVVNAGVRPHLTPGGGEFNKMIQECWASRPQDRPTFSELHHMLHGMMYSEALNAHP